MSPATQLGDGLGGRPVGRPLPALRALYVGPVVQVAFVVA